MDPVTMGLVLGGGQLLGNLFGSYQQGEAAKAAARAQAAATQAAIEEQRRAYADVQDIWSPYQELGDTYLKQLAGGIGRGDYDTPTLGNFEYGQTVQDFLDKSMEYQQTQAQRALEQSAVMGGNLQSGGTLKALQNQAQDYAMQDWGNAYNRMTSDKSFAYQNFINQFNSQKQAVTDRYNQMRGLANLGTSAASALTGARTGVATNVGNLQTAQGNSNAVSAMVPYQTTQNMVSGVTNALGQGVGAYNQYQMQQQLLNALNGGTSGTIVPSPTGTVFPYSYGGEVLT